MLASIIIPVLNEGDRLASLIGHLRQIPRLPHEHFEVIVVDGGSRDASPDIATTLADQVVHSSPGRALQMNKGAEHATGDVLVFLHADSMPPRDLFEQCSTLCHSTKAWSFSAVRLDDTAIAFRVIEWFMNMRSMLSGIATGDQMISVKAGTFRRLKGYASIALMEDIELSKRLKKESRPIFFKTPVVCSARKWRKHGVIRTVVMMWLLRAAYFSGVKPERLHAIYYA